MPSVKMPRKSTDFDMTPFVDVAFLILSFFMMATKFKPPEPVEITTPNSVSSAALEQMDAVMIMIDKDNSVYFSAFSEKDPSILDNIIQDLNTEKNLGLTPSGNGRISGKQSAVGVPFTQLKGLLDLPMQQQRNLKQPGIPVLDSTK